MFVFTKAVFDYLVAVKVWQQKRNFLLKEAFYYLGWLKFYVSFRKTVKHIFRLLILVLGTLGT